MSNRVLNDKQIKDVSVENNELDNHDIEIVNSLPKSGEEYYYLISKEKRKSVIPFSSVDIEYFDKLDVEDKAAFICMSRVQRDEHINYLRSADSYENNTYITHPAFKNNKGFWISKYEISKNGQNYLFLPKFVQPFLLLLVHLYQY